MKWNPRFISLLFPLFLFLGITVFFINKEGLHKGDEKAEQAKTPRPSIGEKPNVFSEDLRFDEWLTKYQNPTESRASIKAEGLALAAERRERMSRLIRENPEQALREAVSYAEWLSLPEDIQVLIEKPFSDVVDYSFYPVCAANGILPPGSPLYMAEIHTAQGKQWEAFVFGRRNDVMSKRKLPVHGIALDGLAAIREEVLQKISAQEFSVLRDRYETDQVRTGNSFSTGKPIVGNPTYAVAGGQIFAFSEDAEIDNANARLMELEAKPGPVAATSFLLPNGNGSIDWNSIESFAFEQASAWTETKKRVYLIRVNFSNNTADPVTQASASSVLNGTVSDQIRAISYGKTWIEATVSANLYTMPQTTTYYINNGTALNAELLRDARNTFRNTKSGADAAINIGPFSATGNGDSGGLGNYDIVGITFSSLGLASGGVTYAGLAGGGNLWMQGNNDSGVYVHEFGHNYGIGHASSWDTTNGSIVGTGTSVEYGDSFDIMGGGADPEGQFHTQAKAKLDWLSPTQWADATVQGSNTYRIHHLDNANAPNTSLRGVRINKAIDEFYWLGYRTAFSDNKNLQKGLYLNWQRPSQTRCWLLDTTPNSANGKQDAPLVLGRTYSDSAAGIHLTPLEVGGSGADRWIDVRVNLGAFPGNNAPIAGAIVGPSSVAARSSASFSVSASDPNADLLSYFWDTKDGVVNDNTNSHTHTWITGGTYQIDLTVSDMKGGAQTVSKSITVTDPLDTWTQQSSGSTGYLRAAVWGKDRFVIAELFGSVLTSWDGVTWKNVGDLPDFDRDPRLAFGNGMFVAVGKINGAASNQICYSADARTWIKATFPAGAPLLKEVIFANNSFVAVGDTGTVMRSTDGMNWTLSTISGLPNFRKIAHNGNVWMAIAVNSFSNQAETVWTSANATSWSQGQNLGFDVYGITSKGSTFYSYGWYGGIQYSTDNGVTWQNASTPGSTRWSTDQMAIAADGTFLVTAQAMDEGGTPHALLVSNNGREWSRSSVGASFAGDIQVLVYGFGRFLASADGGVIRTSNNLYPSNSAPTASLALAPSNVPARSNRLFSGNATDAEGDSLTYYWDFGLPGAIVDAASVVKSFDFGGTYTATLRVFDNKGGLSTLTQTVTVSDAARDFTQRNSGTTNSLNAIAANSSLAVAVGSGGVIRSSPDGMTWTARSVSEFTGNMTFRGIVWDGAKFIAVGSDYNFTAPANWQGCVYTSTNGITWTRRYGATNRNDELQAIATDGTASVAVGNNGAILQSSDGITWNAVTVAGLASTSVKGVAYGNGTYVLTGHAGSNGTPKIFTSTDRVNWVDVTSGTLGLASWQDIRKIAWLNDRFVSSGWYSNLRVSTTQGASFIANRSDAEETPALAFGDGIYLAAGINRSASDADIDLLSLDGVSWTRSSAPTTANRNGAAYFKRTFITVGDAGSIWQSADLTPSSSTNNPPTFSGLAVSTSFQNSLSIPLASVLAAASDLDNDVVLVTSVENSAQGGTTQLQPSSIYFTPASNFTGSDSVPITLTDARGALINASISITVQSATDPTLSIPPSLTLLSGGTSVRIDFTGLPSASYQIQRSINLTSWATISSLTAASNGGLSYTDPSPPAGKAFYRIAKP